MQQRRFWLTVGLGLALALGLLALVNLAAPVKAAGEVLYVTPGGAGAACVLAAPCGSVQTALNLAPTGAEVWAASGLYTENLTLTRTVTLRGGWNLSFTVQDFASPTVLVDAGAVDHNARIGMKDTPLAAVVVLEGITLRGGNDGVHIWSSDDSGHVTFTHVLVENVAQQGFEIDGGAVVISASQVLSAQRGIEVDAGVVQVAGALISNTLEEGFLLEAGGVVTVTGSTFNAAGQQGVQVNDGMLWFQENTVTRMMSESILINGGTVLLDGNVVRDGLTEGYPGIYVEPADGATTNVILQGNEVFNIPDHGIYVRGTLGLMTGNVVHDVTGNGLYVREGDATVMGNHVSAVEGRGVYVRDDDTPTLEQAVVNRNTIVDTGDVGIDVRGAAAQVMSNTITATADRGIDVRLGSAEIAFNTVGQTGGDGIRTVEDNSAALIHHNTVRDTADDGIDAGGVGVEVRANIVTGSGDNGVKATHTGTPSLTISANHIYSNATLGIAVRQAAHFSLVNNMVGDNGLGAVEISGDGAGDLIHNTLVGSGVGQQGVGVTFLGAPTAALVNNLVVSHTVGITGALASHVMLTRTLLWGNGSDPISNTAFIIPPIETLFVAPAQQDYHLLLDAFAVDRGVLTGVTEDVDGDPRPRGKAPDIGADETPPGISHLYLPLVLRTYPLPPAPPVLPDVPAYYLYVTPADLAYLDEHPYLNDTVPGIFVVGGRTWEVDVRYRGDTARRMPKKSWQVEFPSSDPFTDTWEMNLNADYIDQTLLRSAVGYDLLARAGVPTPQVNYARLYLNGAYYGLFSQVEDVEAGFLYRQGFESHGNLYKPDYGNLEWPQPWEDVDSYWNAQYPKLTNTKSGYKDMRDFVYLINHTPDDQFAETIAGVLDVPGWFDWYAVNILLGNFEMLEKNHYLYHDLDAGKWRVLPWDVDLALGHNATGFGTSDPLFDYTVSYDNPIDSGTLESKKVDGKWNALIEKMLNVPEFRYYHGRRLLELMNEGGTAASFSYETMAARIDYFYEIAAPYGAADPNRWRRDDFPFSVGPTELKDYVAGRRAWLLAHLPAFMAGMQPPLTLNEVQPRNASTLADEAGDFAPWLELYNASAAIPWDVSGMYLSDDAAQPLKWCIPAGTTLSPRSTLLIWADGETGEGALHANFTLAPTGTLFLSDRALFDYARVAELAYTDVPTDAAYGLFPDGETPQMLAAPTPGWRNVGHAPIITDVTHTPALPAADQPVIVTAWIAADDPVTVTLRYRTAQPLQPAGAWLSLPMVKNELRIANDELRVTNDELRMTNYELRMTSEGPAALQPTTHNPQPTTRHSALSTQHSALLPAQPANTRVEYFIEAVGAAGQVTVAYPGWPDGGYSYIVGWTPPTLVINEVMARNLNTVEDENGKTPDWIEIYNPGPQDVDMGGMYLTDDPAFPNQSEIPAGAVVPAGGYLLFWADGAATGLHLNFSLSGEGEAVALFDRLDRGAGRIDAAFFPPQSFDESWGRFPNGSATWAALDTPTPGALNRWQPPRFTDVTRAPQWPTADQPVVVSALITAGMPIVSATLWVDVGSGFTTIPMSGAPFQGTLPGQPAGTVVRYFLDAVDTLGQHSTYPADAPGAVESYIVGHTPPRLVINEFLAANTSINTDEAGEYDDWVELYNAGDAAVLLDGMYLSDNLTDPQKWAFPAGVSIPAGGYLLIWCDGQPGQGALHTSFKLAREGEELGLFDSDANGNVALDTLTFGLQSDNISYGRTPDGGSAWVFFTTPTPGGSNE